MEQQYIMLIVIVVVFGGMMWWQSKKAKQQQQEKQDFRRNLQPGTEVIFRSRRPSCPRKTPLTRPVTTTKPRRSKLFDSVAPSEYRIAKA